MYRSMQSVESRKNSMALRKCKIWPILRNYTFEGKGGRVAKRRGWKTLTGGACQKRRKKTLPLPFFTQEPRLSPQPQHAVKDTAEDCGEAFMSSQYFFITLSPLFTSLIFTDANLSRRNSVQCLDENLAVDLSTYAQFKVSLNIWSETLYPKKLCPINNDWYGITNCK